MIHIASVCGTCNGSYNALSKVYEIYERELKNNSNKKIYIYKEILHNPKVIDELNDLGIETIDDLKVVKKGDIVILRAHGEGKEVYDYLDKKHIEYYDATCPKVKVIHEKVSEMYASGRRIVLIGKSNHPEVIGTNGWCDNKAIIINSLDDLDKVKEIDHLFVTCQTTIPSDLFLNITSSLEEMHKDMIVYNATCNAVANICKSSISLAKKCDFMFVIGGEDSSNTEIIFQNVSKYAKSYKFSNILDFMSFILKSDFEGKEIGLTGGASTPIKEIYNYKYLLSFLLFYKERLPKFIKNQKKINEEIYSDTDNDIVKKLINSFKDLNQDGKYIRATLIALGYLMSGKDDLDYLDLASSYELFETSILVHDDIIDNAKLRRGKETIPRRVCQEYIDLSYDKVYQNDVLKLANSLAICAGDLGFYEANKKIVKSYAKNKNLAKVLEFFDDIVIKTIKGEIIDVTLPFVGKYNFREVSENDILEIFHLKTSWYTIIGPFFLGYILGGKKIDPKMESILNKIGLAFQIKDDILGIFGDTLLVGKSSTDITEFKQTIMYSYVIKTSYKDDFLKIYGNKEITNNDLQEVKNILQLSGAYSYALDFLDNLYGDALEEIDELKVEEEYKDIIKGLLIYINNREK